MTEARKLKQAIRARAAKTGESYTAARQQVLKARQKGKPQPPRPRPTTPAPRRRAAGPQRDGGGRQDGPRFDHWFAVLDAFGAAAKGHTAAARHLATTTASRAGTRRGSPSPTSARAGCAP